MTSPVLPPILAMDQGVSARMASGATWFSCERPVQLEWLDGTTMAAGYDELREVAAGVRGEFARETASGLVEIADHWRAIGPDCVRVERRLRVVARDGSIGAPIQVRLRVRFPSLPSDARRFVPALRYSAEQYGGEPESAYADHRLSALVVAVYAPRAHEAMLLARASLPMYDDRASRGVGETRFAQRTDVGSLGIGTDAGGPTLEASWPYHERGWSSALDSSGVAPVAFHPIDGGLDVDLVYEIVRVPGVDYAEAARRAYQHAMTLAKSRAVALPFSLEEAIAFRVASLTHTYREWGDDGAGFVLNFDPSRGYDAPARGFGASFADLAFADSQAILEYGFTGRQLSVAATLAERLGGEWIERAERVTNFFVRHMALPSGWLHAHYDIHRRRPLFACGDPDGPFMHYLAPADRPGTYLRLMVEAATDLLVNVRRASQHDRPLKEWLEVCAKFGDLLVRIQGRDGAWSRAYDVDGAPLLGPWFGETVEEAASGTSLPIPYLLEIAAEMPDRAPAYIAAAVRGGEVLLARQVAFDTYRGGTLDNPNAIDKEAAGFAMRALVALHRATDDDRWLQAARRAADIFVTWNVVWPVPGIPGTRVAAAGVNSTGWGGINPTWGAGVVDIYSLFFLDDLVELGRTLDQPLYGRVAELVIHGTQQLLAHPGDLHGFAGIGMQPEGIALADQGIDEGLISKGDTWGGLGWIYTAGTEALGRASAAIAASRWDAAGRLRTEEVK